VAPLEAHLKRYLVNYWCHNSVAELLDGEGDQVAVVPTSQEVREAGPLEVLGVGYCLEAHQNPVRVPETLLLAVPPQPMMEPWVKSRVALLRIALEYAVQVGVEEIPAGPAVGRLVADLVFHREV